MARENRCLKGCLAFSGKGVYKYWANIPPIITQATRIAILESMLTLIQVLTLLTAELVGDFIMLL